MIPKKPVADEPIYQIKVTIIGSEPSIWRQIQVPGNVSLHRLHLILQAVMGWQNYHLYRFNLGGTDYGLPDSEEDAYNKMEVRDARQTKLSSIVPMDETRFLYEYDFGDSWEHEVLVERIGVKETKVLYPVCVSGARACPPEDCGGIPGYAELLKVLGDPNHEEYHNMKEWAGPRFDPEKFSLAKVNRLLKTMRRW